MYFFLLLPLQSLYLQWPPINICLDILVWRYPLYVLFHTVTLPSFFKTNVLAPFIDHEICDGMCDYNAGKYLKLCFGQRQLYPKNTALDFFFLSYFPILFHPFLCPFWHWAESLCGSSAWIRVLRCCLCLVRSGQAWIICLTLKLSLLLWCEDNPTVALATTPHHNA